MSGKDIYVLDLTDPYAPTLLGPYNDLNELRDEMEFGDSNLTLTDEFDAYELWEVR